MPLCLDGDVTKYLNEKIKESHDHFLKLTLEWGGGRGWRGGTDTGSLDLQFSPSPVVPKNTGFIILQILA